MYTFQKLVTRKFYVHLQKEELALNNNICPTKKLGQKQRKEDDTKRTIISTTNARAREQIGANLWVKSS